MPPTALHPFPSITELSIEQLYLSLLSPYSIITPLLNEVVRRAEHSPYFCSEFVEKNHHHALIEIINFPSSSHWIHLSNLPAKDVSLAIKAIFYIAQNAASTRTKLVNSRTVEALVHSLEYRDLNYHDIITSLIYIIHNNPYGCVIFIDKRGCYLVSTIPTDKDYSILKSLDILRKTIINIIHKYSNVYEWVERYYPKILETLYADDYDY